MYLPSANHTQAAHISSTPHLAASNVFTAALEVHSVKPLLGIGNILFKVHDNKPSGSLIP